MTKISILLPVYNDELFIRKSISSVLSNTYKDYEIIIVNDGSTDNSLNELNYFADNRIKIYNKIHSGLIETLNYGLKKCSNEIIMRMDADDEIENDKIAKQITLFKNTKPIVLGTGGTIIDNFSKFKRSVNVPEAHIDILKKINQLKASIIHASIMINKDTLLKVGGYDSKFEIAEDYELFLRLSRYGQLRNMNYPLYNIRKNNDNVSQTRASTQLLNTLVARKIYTDKECKSVTSQSYTNTKKYIQQSINYRLLKWIYINLNNSKNYLISLILKIFRRLLIQLN